MSGTCPGDILEPGHTRGVSRIILRKFHDKSSTNQRYIRELLEACRKNIEAYKRATTRYRHNTWAETLYVSCKSKTPTVLEVAAGNYV